jgi:hypothetical protein
MKMMPMMTISKCLDTRGMFSSREARFSRAPGRDAIVGPFREPFPDLTDSLHHDDEAPAT